MFTFLLAVEQEANTSAKRFALNALFDRNVLLVIVEYLKVSLTPMIIGDICGGGGGNTQFHLPYSVQVHPITGHLWVADTHNKRLCVHNIERSFMPRLYSIECQGSPLCVRISRRGRVFVTEYGPSAVTMYKLDLTTSSAMSVPCVRFGEGRMMACFFGMAINDTTKQIAVADDKRYCIDVYSLDGLFNRTMKTSVVGTYGMCWNESENLLFVSSWHDHCVHVIDVTNNTKIAKWGSGQGSNHGQFNSPGGIAYRADVKQLLVADISNCRVEVMDWKGAHIKSYGTGERRKLGQLSYPTDIAFHPRDNRHLIVCERGNHQIQIIPFE
jgi:hypothetical protein